MSFKSGFASRERERERERKKEKESRSLTEQMALSSKSGARQCWTIVWWMMSVEMTRTAVGRMTIKCCVRWCATKCAGS